MPQNPRQENALLMKTTKADFEIFKNSVLKWQEKLGLYEWSIYLDHKKEPDTYAKTYWSTSSMTATIVLATEWDDLRPRSPEELDKLALHELMHVVLAPLISEAEYRYSTQEGIDAAEHSIVRRFENLIGGQLG